MNFDYSDEQSMIRDMLDRFIREQHTIDTRGPQHARPPADRAADMWDQFAELGVIGALFPEEAGGFGGTGEDYMLVFECLGRGLVTAPFLGSAVLGATPLLLAGSEDQLALLGDVIGGTLRLALGHAEPDSRYCLSYVKTTAAPHAGGWRLTGRKAIVLDAPCADKLLISARVSGDIASEDGLGLFLVDAHADGLSMQSYRTGDGRPAAELTLTDCSAQPVGDVGSAFGVLEHTIARATLALCAEAVGIMARCHAETLQYLKTREQFGKPIGVNQVLQHRMVDLLIEIEQARSLVMKAASVVGGPRDTREMTISAAKFLVGRAGHLVAQETIQMHGAIGLTWEYEITHFVKRLTLIDHLLGDMNHHIQRFSGMGRTRTAKLP